MTKQINNISDLKAARAEAALKAEKARSGLTTEKEQLREDFEGLKSISAGIRSAISIFSGTSGNSSNIQTQNKHKGEDQFLNLLIGLLSGLGKRKIDWRPILISIFIWLLKNGYFEKLVSLRKSEVYALLLTFVRNLREKLKSHNA